MTVRTKLLIFGEFATAIAVCGFALTHSGFSGAGIFLLLLGLSIATGAMKVVLPRIQGNLSASYLFLMWGIVHMSLGETLVMGWAASLVQSYWRAKRKPTPIQLLFNLSLIAVSIGTGSLVFNWAFMEELVPNQIVRMLLAALAYFAVNTGSVSSVVGLTEHLPVWKVWRSSYLWSFPHYLLSASVVALFGYLEKRVGIEVTLLFLPPAYLVYQTFALQITRLNEALERVEQEKRHVEETACLHLRTIRSLALAIEAKDQTTGEHLHRVQTYAMGLAEDFNLSPAELDALRAAAILHDVGKIAVPQHIISKPGKLTPDEFTQMKIHTIVGAEIVASADFPFAVAPLVRAHHEKWNGSGYPDGLKGKEIPLGARILSAVDCLDALASDRQYRKAMPLDKAMSIIVAESGKSFDPAVVEALSRRCHELERLATSTLPGDTVTFSTNATIARGFAPDAGYAHVSQQERDVSTLVVDDVTREMSILRSLESQIGRSGSVESDLLAIDEELQKLIPYDCLTLYRQRGNQLECTFAKGDVGHPVLGRSMASGVGASGWTAANRTALLNGSAATDFAGSDGFESNCKLSSSLSVPLDSESGVIGVLTLYRFEQSAFNAGHLRILLAISSKLAYHMSLGSFFAGMLSASRHPEDVVRTQLTNLSESIQHDFAYSESTASRIQ